MHPEVEPGRFVTTAGLLADELSSLPGILSGQIAIWEHGSLVLDFSHSNGTGIYSSAALLNLWCGTKVAVQTALLSALWRQGSHEFAIGELLDDAISHRLPPQLAATTPAELISNTYPLAKPHVLVAMLQPTERRLDLTLDFVEASSPAPPVAGTYAATKLLIAAVEAATGSTGEALVRQWCTDHLQFASELVFDVDRARLASICETISPYVLEHYDEPVASYHDRTEAIACTDRLAAGGYASARALAEFYSVVAGHGSESDDFLDWMWSRPAVAVDDPGMDAPTTFVAGFHTSIPGVETRPMLGHPGLTGASYGLAIPEHGLGIAFTVNRFFQSRVDIDFLRARLIRSILRDTSRT